MRPVCFSDVTDLSDEDFASLCALKETIVNASTRSDSTGSGEDASMTDASDERLDTASKTSVRESDAVVVNDAASAEDDHDVDDDEITELATEERVVDDTVLMVDAECEYEVYVSYAEVYNEQVTLLIRSRTPSVVSHILDALLVVRCAVWVDFSLTISAYCFWDLPLSHRHSHFTLNRFMTFLCPLQSVRDERHHDSVRKMVMSTSVSSESCRWHQVRMPFDLLSLDSATVELQPLHLTSTRVDHTASSRSR